MVEKKTLGEHIFDVFNTALMIILCLVFIYPFIYEVNLSISDSATASRMSLRLLPSLPPEFTAYKEILTNPAFLLSVENTLIRTIGGTALTVLATFFGAWVLSKRRMPLNRLMTIMILFTMFFSGGLIPTYLNMKKLGLIGTRWALILPSLTSAWYLLIARNFISSLPASLEEAAVIDGAGVLDILFRIVMPLSKPVMAVIALWSSLGHWNSWYDAMLYAPSKKLTVLSLYLRRILVENSKDDITGLVENQRMTPETVKAAIIVVSVFPLVAAYPLFQRYFIKGVQVGAVKE